MTKDEVKKLRMNSPESLQFLNNATKFYNLMMMYRCAIREIQTKLEVLDDEFSVENNRNPISFIKTRIKQPNSIYDKLQKMGYEFTTENIQTYLNDVAGVRIVCAFIDDIYMISDCTLKCSQFPSCVDFTGFNGIQNCVYCYYLSFFSKIALKHRPHYFHI